MIINKAGGLIYNKNANPGLQQLSSNDNLILAGTFHGIHAIARSLCPVDIPQASSGPPSSASATAIAGAGGAGASSRESNIPPGFILGETFPGAAAGGAAAAGGGGAGAAGYSKQRRRYATGITSLESSHFRLTVHQTITGVKFLLFTSPEQSNAEGIVKRCHELYATFVMGNPFYSLEMPIRVDKFEREVGRWLARPV